MAEDQQLVRLVEEAMQVVVVSADLETGSLRGWGATGGRVKMIAERRGRRRRNVKRSLSGCLGCFAELRVQLRR